MVLVGHWDVRKETRILLKAYDTTERRHRGIIRRFMTRAGHGKRIRNAFGEFNTTEITSEIYGETDKVHKVLRGHEDKRQGDLTRQKGIRYYRRDIDDTRGD